MKTYCYDAFISFADEDKHYTAQLVKLLEKKGLQVWFSGTELRKKPTDLLDDVNQGMAQSKYGIAVISSHYIRKKWTKTELGALFAREPEDEKTLIPLWHEITYDELRQKLPIICDRFAFETKNGLEETAQKVYQIIRQKEEMTSPKAYINAPRKRFWQKQKYRLLTLISVLLLLINTNTKTILWGILLTFLAVITYQVAQVYQENAPQKSEAIQEIQQASKTLIEMQLSAPKNTKLPPENSVETFNSNNIQHTDNQFLAHKRDLSSQQHHIIHKTIHKAIGAEAIQKSSKEVIVQDSTQEISTTSVQDSSILDNKENPSILQKSTSDTYHITLNPKKLQQTNIQIQKGQKIQIKASGKLKLGDMPQEITPEGLATSPMLNYRKIYAQYPLGGLIYSIDNSRSWHFCGKYYEFTAKKSGLLNFKINDMQFGVSQGNLEIEIMIQE